IIDGTGMTVYPGFIDAASSALLEPNKIPQPATGRPIDFARFALAATPPDNRRSLTPDFVAHDALKTDAALFEARRKLGFTSVHLVPRDRIAGGFSSLLSTSGLPTREALVVGGALPQFQLFD